MKLTLVGKPAAIIPFEETAVLIMLECGKYPALPKGLPTLTEPTRLGVFISTKQWRKVAPYLEDPKDEIIVEGIPTFKKEFEGLTVLATSVRSKKAEREKAKVTQAAS